jgi:hypothetical protein
MHLPIRTVSGGLQQLFGTRITEHLQAVLQGVGIGGGCQLINKTFMRKRIGQG